MTEAIAAATYLIRKKGAPIDIGYGTLEVRIEAPRKGEQGGPFPDMWVCPCSISGPSPFSEAFPGVDSLQALEYAQIVISTHIAHLSNEYEILRKGSGDKPMQIPLIATSMLAGVLQGGYKLPSS